MVDAAGLTMDETAGVAQASAGFSESVSAEADLRGLPRPRLEGGVSGGRGDSGGRAASGSPRKPLNVCCLGGIALKVGEERGKK